MVYGKFTASGLWLCAMRRLSGFIAILFSAALAPAAWAGDVVFTVVNAKGKPVADAVVTAFPPGLKSGAIRFSWPQEMDQQHLQFDPFVLIVPVGADVTFPNRDPVRHHVYSFSPTHPFELKLYGKDETRSVRFERAGVVALGCNIHDNMVAFIKVVDTPFAAKTDAQGRAVLHGLPAGSVPVKIWHPYLKAAGNEISKTVTAPGSGEAQEQVQLDVRNAPDRRGAY
jgi:plastocyanin